MILIIGGAYQGKLEFAKEEFNLSESDINFCNENDDFLDFNKKCFYNIQLFILSLIKKNIDPIPFFNENINKFKDKIIICEDISSGIVPIDYEMRILREKVGKVLVLFSKNSDKVVRLFCGIPKNLK